MDILITATFHSLHDAKAAVDELKSKITVLDSTFTPDTPRELSFPHLASLYSFTDADRSEQTHGNLIPPLVTHLAQHDGKTRIKLILDTKDSETAKSILRKNKAKSISTKAERD